MRTYEKYKDSGISWIGEIPGEWKIGRFKYNFKVSKGLSITKADLVDDGIPVISYGQVHSKDNTGTCIKKSLLRYVPSKFLYSDKACLVNKGDFIFADTSEDIDGCGNCVYVDTNLLLFAGYHSIIAKSIQGNENKYFSYLFLTDKWRKQIRARVSGVKVFSITQDYLKNTTIIIPPLYEQEAIANYLDKKTAEIDKIIAEREKKIELLNELKSSIISRAVTKGINPHAKMKDSGIDWIGEIPEGWITTKLKYLLHLHNGRAYSQDELLTEGKYKVLRVGNFFTNDKWYYSNFELESIKYCNKGDLLYAWSASFGPYIWDQDKTIYHYHIWKVTLEPTYNKKYAYYMLSALTEYKRSDVHGSTMVHVTMESMNNSFITFPPLQEQREIARYLDDKLKGLSLLSNNINSEISLLHEYKQSLISEVVTGKRKVID